MCSWRALKREHLSGVVFWWEVSQRVMVAPFESCVGGRLVTVFWWLALASRRLPFVRTLCALVGCWLKCATRVQAGVRSTRIGTRTQQLNKYKVRNLTRVKFRSQKIFQIALRYNELVSRSG